MNKQTYEAKLADTITTNQSTVEEVRAAKRAVSALKSFWKKSLNAHLAKEQQVDAAELAHTYELKYKFDLKPTGSVAVEVWFVPAGWGDFGTIMQSATLQRTYRVGKAKLYTQSNIRTGLQQV